MSHVFEFDKIWEMIRRDPKQTKTLTTSAEVKSKRSQNSSVIDVSAAQTHIDLHVDIGEIPDDIEDISPPRQPTGHDKAKRAAKHADDVERKTKHIRGNRSQV